MLGGEDNENGEKTTIGLISKEATFTRAVHFFVYFIAVGLHDYNVKLPGYTFYAENFVRVLVPLFFTVAHFYPGGR